MSGEPTGADIEKAARAKTPLDHHLGAVLVANWRGTNRRAVATTFSKALTDDADLKTAAAARKAELETMDQKCNGQIERRCSVSAIHLRALRAALD